MPKVLCTLPNASDLISGVRFVTHKDGMLSEEISAERAAEFCAVRGYALAPAASAAPAPSGAASGAPAGEAGSAEQQPQQPHVVTPEELDALRARGVALNIPNAATKGAKRLVAEIAEAEKAAAGTK